MQTAFSWIRFAFTIPWTLVCWLLVVFAVALQLADVRKLRFEGTGILTTEWRPWVAKVYPFSVTLGRAMIFYPDDRSSSDGLNDRLETHELVHIAQIEDMMLTSLLVGGSVALATGDPLLGFFIWWSGGLWQLPNFATAILRWGHLVRWPTEGSFSARLKTFVRNLFVGVAYRDNEHERSAYAQTDVRADGSSWTTDRDKSRADRA